MKAEIVVGLGYGDEGKGTTTDFLCNRKTYDIPCVVRYSGGQQAGHTVIKNGVKHVHSNFGAGSLSGIPTYFSEFTTFYPTTIKRERDILLDKGVTPRLVLHPLSKMTTPYDVFENRDCPDTLSHGTCGLGIGKTMKRNEGQYQLYAVDLLHKPTLMLKLEGIKNYYWREDFTEEQLAEIEDFHEAINHLEWDVRGYEFLTRFETLVFEGSQGIMLDMNHGVFPHVTYSNTTSKNAQTICDKLGITKRSMFYITRCYSTRHGNGVYEEQPLELINNEQEINVENKYQGNFKVSRIDYTLLNYALEVDDIYCPMGTKKNLVVTCLDQLPNEDFKYENLKPEFDRIYESYSPDNKDFKLKD